MRLRGCLNHAFTPNGAFARLFVGRKGVHAPWRALLFLALLLAMIFVLALLFSLAAHALHVRPQLRGGQYTPGLIFGNEFLLLLPVLAATVLMAWLEDAKFTAYGLSAARGSSRFAWGVLAGLVALSTLVLLLRCTGHAEAIPGLLTPAGDLRYGAEWAADSLLIGCTEELVFRGYLLNALARATGFWPAALLTSLIFGLLHGTNAGETSVGLFQLIAAGLMLSLSLRRTGALWWAIGFHSAWDYAENFIFGTRDSGVTCYGTLMTLIPHGNLYLSGGATGPEGSLYSLPVIALIALAVWALLGRKSTL
jgi:membrane protease YdiL (CAAX protease family)